MCDTSTNLFVFAYGDNFWNIQILFSTCRYRLIIYLFIEQLDFFSRGMYYFSFSKIIMQIKQKESMFICFGAHSTKI